MEKLMNYSSFDESILSTLPLDLWWKILTLFPVKDLLVVRAVCKRFLSLIDDPDFVNFHLRYFSDNVAGSRFLTVKPYSDLVCEVRKISGSRFSKNPLIRAFIYEPQLRRKAWQLAGSLDGVLLWVASNHHQETRPTAVLLWNPSINKHRLLSLPASNLKNFGFGYDRSRKDYRVVATCPVWGQVWVYSVKTGSWTEILDSGFCSKFGIHSKYEPSMSFNNALIWIEVRMGSYPGNHRLVWFDFETERFRYVDSFPYSQPCMPSSLVRLDGGSTVGVWGVDDDGRGSVWALCTDTMTWTRRYIVAREVMPLRERGDIIERVWFDERKGECTWTYGKCSWKGLSFQRCSVFMSYNVETQRVTRCEKISGLNDDCLGVFVESLVML